ncbi:hypothetical protein K435DRAFT_866020 [Dendrothele bispora CBS 962.96]|uniref:Uncharacterized protein n=1 Tax=Dendrothele bispora (strain CBS 962.96) TaxID=1314807 RepID=A0A4S8LIC2_DENBC|nr:hypothetical protein K435DRAFT_866020 [Dendrothele bispora CBS 962.96]
MHDALMSIPQKHKRKRSLRASWKRRRTLYAVMGARDIKSVFHPKHAGSRFPACSLFLFSILLVLSTSRDRTLKPPHRPPPASVNVNRSTLKHRYINPGLSSITNSVICKSGCTQWTRELDFRTAQEIVNSTRSGVLKNSQNSQYDRTRKKLNRATNKRHRQNETRERNEVVLDLRQKLADCDDVRKQLKEQLRATSGNKSREVRRKSTAESSSSGRVPPVRKSKSVKTREAADPYPVGGLGKSSSVLSSSEMNPSSQSDITANNSARTPYNPLQSDFPTFSHIAAPFPLENSGLLAGHELIPSSSTDFLGASTDVMFGLSSGSQNNFDFTTFFRNLNEFNGDFTSM